MSNLTPQDSFDDVYQIKRGDQVDALGVSNDQAQANVNRTHYLNERRKEMQQTLDELGSAAEHDTDEFATAEQGEKADAAISNDEKGAADGVATLDHEGRLPFAQHPVTPQAVLTENVELDNNHNGKVVFCAADHGIHLTLAEGLDLGWEVTLIKAGTGLVRVDGNVLSDNNANTLTNTGSGMALMKLAASVQTTSGRDFWLAGDLTEYRADLTLADESLLELASSNDTLEITTKAD